MYFLCLICMPSALRLACPCYTVHICTKLQHTTLHHLLLTKPPLALKSAPSSSNRLTMSILPHPTARCSGVGYYRNTIMITNKDH